MLSPWIVSIVIQKGLYITLCCFAPMYIQYCYTKWTTHYTVLLSPMYIQFRRAKRTAHYSVLFFPCIFNNTMHKGQQISLFCFSSLYSVMPCKSGLHSMLFSSYIMSCTRDNTFHYVAFQVYIQSCHATVDFTSCCFFLYFPSFLKASRPDKNLEYWISVNDRKEENRIVIDYKGINGDVSTGSFFLI